MHGGVFTKWGQLCDTAISAPVRMTRQFMMLVTTQVRTVWGSTFQGGSHKMWTFFFMTRQILHGTNDDNCTLTLLVKTLKELSLRQTAGQDNQYNMEHTT